MLDFTIVCFDLQATYFSNISLISSKLLSLGKFSTTSSYIKYCSLSWKSSLFLAPCLILKPNKTDTSCLYYRKPYLNFKIFTVLLKYFWKFIARWKWLFYFTVQIIQLWRLIHIFLDFRGQVCKRKYQNLAWKNVHWYPYDFKSIIHYER